MMGKYSLIGHAVIITKLMLAQVTCSITAFVWYVKLGRINKDIIGPSEIFSMTV